MKQYQEKLTGLLKGEMKPALGVTEISAVALACSRAHEAVDGKIRKIEVTTDPGLFKNTYSCRIPGTEEAGHELAAILGALAGGSDLGLEVLSNIEDKDVIEAKELRDEGKCDVNIEEGLTEVLVDARVTTDKGVGRAVIKNAHTNIVLVEANDNTLFEKEKEREEKEKNQFDLTALEVSDFKKFVDEVPFGDIDFVLESIEMNKKLVEEGLEGAGMEVGATISKFLDGDRAPESAITHAQILTACGVDARLGGVRKPAMSIAGSGAHGIIATMPLYALAEDRSLGEEKLARAIALSYLITLYIKKCSGKLSAFCGCAIAAGTGASAGSVYLMGGDQKQIEHAINNMGGNVTGMICDGGNLGCALKAATGAGAAVMSAFLSMENTVIPEDSGIVGETVEETMKNMGKIASPGMVKTDEVILNIMRERTRD